MAPVHQTVIFYQSMTVVSFLFTIILKYISNLKKKKQQTSNKPPNVVMETFYWSLVQNVSAQLKDSIDIFLIKILQCSKIRSFAVWQVL